MRDMRPGGRRDMKATSVKTMREGKHVLFTAANPVSYVRRPTGKRVATGELEMRVWKVLAAAMLIAGAANGPFASRAQAGGGAQVILLKGLADVFSNGMDTLAAELRQRGVSARVASHSSGLFAGQ